MAETYAEYRYFASEALDQRYRDPRLGRRAGTGRDDDLFRSPRRDLLERDRIVAIHIHVGTQFAEVLDEVVGEAVVVVDHQDHGAPGHWSMRTRTQYRTNFSRRIGVPSRFGIRPWDGPAGS